MKYFFCILLITNALTNALAQKAPKPYGALPSTRQLRWHEVERYGLVHFTPTTFEDKEWGFGDADPRKFDPKQFDAQQIVKAAKAGGLRGLILVAKHHDGFCLWPTKTTDYNISKSPFRGGKGDLVREMEQACRKNGLQFGVYCSPWDRNNAQYGTADYVKTYRAQLRELYAQYGPLFMSWHDGANGGDGYYGGKSETRNIDRTTSYGWDSTWTHLTRKMQPTANIFSDIGWDVRWVGNEKGHAAETSWATFTPAPPKGKSVAVPGQNNDEENPTGTRNGKFWIPAECDVPLRGGWFFHPKESPKTPEKLVDLYFKSVGRGADLDLGLAPDTRGLLHEDDAAALKSFGQIIEKTFAENLAKNAKLIASNVRGQFVPKNLLDNDRYTYWATNDNVTTPELTIDLVETKTFDVIRLRENIKLGQRIEGFTIDIWQNNTWQQIASATSIGANRLVRLPAPVSTTKVRLRITASPVCIALSDFGLFLLQN